MKNLINRYKKIFDELIPNSKKDGFYCFSKSVNVNLFFKDLKRIDPSSYKIISKRLISKNQLTDLIGHQILEAYFLSKEVLKKLKKYEKKKFLEKKFIKDEIKLIKIKKNND